MLISKKNKRILFSAVLIVCLGFILFFGAQTVLAQAVSGSSSSSSSSSATSTPSLNSPSILSAIFDPKSFALSFFSFFVNVAIYFLGQLLIILIHGLVAVSKYNRFIDTPFVITGWTMLRDVVNMFFIVGMLFIAFVTVLNRQKYEWSKLLFRLLLMAILVNFSRTILGLIIDAFQVIMLTFVGAYQSIAAQTLFSTLGIADYGTFNGDAFSTSSTVGQVTISSVQIVGSLLLAVFYIVIATIVIGIFFIILVYRIVALWVLIVLSPLAFFAWIFENSSFSRLSSQFWGNLFQYCFIGPVLAFFLWLSLATMEKFNNTYLAELTGGDSTSQAGLSMTLSAAGTFTVFMKYMIGIMTLVAGLIVANKFQVIGASYAKGATDWLKKNTAGRAENWAKKSSGYAVDKAKEYSGFAAKEGLQRVERGGGTLGALAKGTRLVGTKAGREILGERAKAQMESRIGGKPGALVEQRNKELKLYEDQYRKMGVSQNPEMMASQLKKASGDRRLALLNILGTEGKMTKEIYQKSLEDGDFEHFGVKTKKDAETGETVIDFEKSDQGGLANLESLGKNWENAYEKRTHLPISFSPFVRNKITNQWEKTGPGQEGENKRLQDVEDSLAKQRDLQEAVSSGDFANTDDLRISIAHLSGAGRNSYLKTSGKEAQKKYRETADNAITRLSGTLEEQKNIAESMADKKGLKGKERDNFVLKQLENNQHARQNITAEQMKNIQEGYQVSTGEWEPGSGRGIKGGSNKELAEIIKRNQEKMRPKHSEARKNSADLISEVDGFMPELLENTKTLPLDQRIKTIRESAGKIMGQGEANKIFSGEDGADNGLIAEYIKNAPEIMAQKDTKDDYGDNFSSRLNNFSAKVGSKTGATDKDIAMTVASLNSLKEAMKQDIESAGLSEEYFELEKLEAVIKEISALSGKGRAQQRSGASSVLDDARAIGYFKAKAPNYKKEGASSVEQEPTIYAPSGRPIREEMAGSAPGAPSNVNVTNITNVTNNFDLNQQTQNILSQSANNDQLVENLSNMQKEFGQSLSAMKKELGAQFDETLAQNLQNKMRNLVAEISSSPNLSANRQKVENAIDQISSDMKKISSQKAK